MTDILTEIALPPPFPDHTQLPESDGSFVKNFQEHPQSLILTDSIDSTLQRLHPNGNYAIGQDCARIYNNPLQINQNSFVQTSFMLFLRSGSMFPAE